LGRQAWPASRQSVIKRKRVASSAAPATYALHGWRGPPHAMLSQRKAGVHARVLGIHLAGILRLAAVAPAFRVKRRPGRSTCPFQCPAVSAGRLLAHDLDAVELRRRSFAVAVQGRCGRGLPPPSGRMRACAADAPGRHLGCWIMKCCYGQGCRMRAVSSRRAAMRMIRAALAPEKFVSRSPPLLQSVSCPARTHG
jgi:hypothetical protein